VESTSHEGLHFFTSRAQTFGLPNHQPKHLAQVVSIALFFRPGTIPTSCFQISIAACHDDQNIFEITPEIETAANKTKITGGLLTTVSSAPQVLETLAEVTQTFIQFMEQDSQQKTLDDMLHYLS
jgi:hypothetical protein